MLRARPCVDSDEHAARRRTELGLPSHLASELGHTALEITREGAYSSPSGERVDIRPLLQAALRERVSIPPDAPLPARAHERGSETWVQVRNETTMAAGCQLVAAGRRTLALNFANGVAPGGGFLHGARAQEEVLCRSSALFATLEGDPMYDAHRSRLDRESSDWAILSPHVPFFRHDDGTPLAAPFLLSVLTCAAPVATKVGQPRAGDLLAKRIERVLAIAEAWEYDCLVLGAWGCGAFGNDPARTARDFRAALEGPFRGAFREVVFAITDWSPERRFLGPFREVFA